MFEVHLCYKIQTISTIFWAEYRFFPTNKYTIFFLVFKLLEKFLIYKRFKIHYKTFILQLSKQL